MNIVTRPTPVYSSDVIMKNDATDYEGWAYDFYPSLKATEDEGLFGKDVTVAVLDTGGPRHKDIKPHTIEDHRTHPHVYTPDGDNRYDYDYHSTHVGGILFAKHNGFGVKGLVPKSKSIFLKVLGDNGSGIESDVAKGIVRAGELGAQYGVMSLGANSDMKKVKAAVSFAYKEYGIIFFCAAGNDGKDNHIDSPANSPLTLCIASHDDKGKRSSFSDNGQENDLYAPGDKILSCYGRDQYRIMSGTSQAAPFAAGMVAKYHHKLIEKYGKVTPEIIRDLASVNFKL